MTWSGKRQTIIASIVIGAVALFGFILIYPSLNKAPSCVDLKQNGGEAGVDCGGPCANYCSAQIEPLVIKWKRAFNIVGSTYTLVAYIENHNSSAIIRHIPYEFRVYDQDNKFLAVRDGTTYITPNGPFVIFEPGVNLGNRVPARVTFKFLDENPTWVKADATELGKVITTTKDFQLTDTTSTPRVTATLVNQTTYTIRDADIYVILYDSDDNAIAVSKTYLSTIDRNSESPLLFTWPKPFDRTVVRNEILVKFNEENATR